MWVKAGDEVEEREGGKDLDDGCYMAEYAVP